MKSCNVLAELCMKQIDMAQPCIAYTKAVCPYADSLPRKASIAADNSSAVMGCSAFIIGCNACHKECYSVLRIMALFMA